VAQHALIDGSGNVYVDDNGLAVVVLVPTANLGPLPCIVNNKVMPTNADEPAYMNTFVLEALNDPPPTVYNVVINGKLVVMNQQQFIDVFTT